ncbi:MAG TPA: ABC transporter permease [Muribaculum sp.]|uniref:ABC transporter permease n=1 Tax=Heminiphilus faecis TaxID=2601703 RepID=UPI000EF5F572|nr:ABC transporter permease [Heminiphilus faecis]RLT77229.1 ABC transporter permease [bacterium J10(2018)]HRF68471.1 ABC transporter permease [Muribaculum sp.]
MSSIRKALIDGIKQLTSRPIYILGMIVVPMFVAFFFLDLMDEGLPLKAPTAIVDLDNSSASRNVTRNLSASELVSLDYRPVSYDEAMKLLKSGDIFGFFMIPRNFQADAAAGRETTITYYCNMAYFVPGTLSFKSFKQTAVTSSGGIAKVTLVSAGLSEDLVGTMLQPVTTQEHPIGNPWTNYSIYLSNSFVPCLLQLIIFQFTAFSILQEIKRGTSVQWMNDAGGSILVACAGKLIPQFVIFSVVGLAIQSMLYGYWGFPVNGSMWGMIVAMLLLVASSQAFALLVSSLIPNLRFALSILSLLGILSFSLAGFSFPVENMYPMVGVFAYIIPVRYYFLIYINTALNGYELYYVRWEYIAMLLFLLTPFTMLWKLKRSSLHPVYIP